jgi:hypothetical protein
MFKLIFRIIIDIVIFVCLVQGWWHFTLLLALIGIWNFGFYIEIILAGLIYDALYGSVAVKGLTGSIGLIVGAILFMVLTVIKRIVRIRE